MRTEGSRAQVIVIAAALLVFVVVQVAIAGPGPTAESSGGLKAKVKGLSRQVATLTAQVAALQGKQQPTSLPPSGPASGDLTGSYPGPSLAQPAAPTSAGLGDFSGGSCGAFAPGYYNQNSFSNNSAGYYRDRQGRVFLQGLIIKCGAPAGAVFTLPAGFRPAKAEEEPGVLAAGGTTAVGIENNGNVIVNLISGDIFGLDGISFRCSPSGVGGCP